jgi:SAM-dependent methyltransferase
MRDRRKSLCQRLTEELIWLDSRYGHPPWHKLLVKRVFSSILDKEDRVIEIGCGAGGLSRRLAEIVTEGEVVGIDVSEEYMKRLRRSMETDDAAPPNLSFRLGSAEDIPCPDDYFDLAVCTGAFSFWSEPERGLVEVRRVLKPGGKLYIVDVYEEGAIWVTGGARAFDLWSPHKMNVYSSEEFRQFLRNAGFTVVYQKDVGGTLVTVGTKSLELRTPGLAGQSSPEGG